MTANHITYRDLRECINIELDQLITKIEEKKVYNHG